MAYFPLLLFVEAWRKLGVLPKDVESSLGQIFRLVRFQRSNFLVSPIIGLC